MYKLMETSNAKSEPCSIRYETYQYFMIAMYGVMNYSLFMPNLVAFYANILKYELNFILC